MATKRASRNPVDSEKKAADQPDTQPPNTVVELAYVVYRDVGYWRFLFGVVLLSGLYLTYLYLGHWK